MKVKIVNGNYEYDQLFRSLGHSLVSVTGASDLVCFTGGADVHPWLYGDSQHKLTMPFFKRDREESLVFNEALSLGIPMVGICRGGQFLNVMNGGRMYQHITGHLGNHEIIDLITGETVLVSSTHHQMIMKAPEGVLVASSGIGGEREWYDKGILKRDYSDQDQEVVFYEKSKCLCFQPHPEFGGDEYAQMRAYFASLLDRYLNVK